MSLLHQFCDPLEIALHRELLYRNRRLITQRRAKPNAGTRLTLEIYILAGGGSVRMGRDKSRLRLGRRTMLEHVRATARELGYPVRALRHDLVPQCGPIGGVYTALSTTRAKAVLFLSNDMPFVSTRLLRSLKARFKPGVKAVFVMANRFAGFPFLLRREALSVVENRISNEEYSLQGLAEALTARVIRLPRRHEQELLNVNTPEDFVMARQRWRTLRRKNSRLN